ncbi:MAG: Holliday junction branch migration protein RuvA [Planctomycetota bacterium]
MFNHVSGKLLEKSPSHAVLEAAGVGYLLRISLATYERLPSPESECRLLTRMLVREDSRQLVGFTEEAEREVFDALISVNGVGPNLALAVLSAMRPEELAAAVRADDAAAFRRVKGLGTKKAERIVLELRGRVEQFGAAAAAAGGTGPAPAGPAGDAVKALLTLAYKRPEAEAAVQRALAELGAGAETAELIRRALTHTR